MKTVFAMIAAGGSLLAAPVFATDRADPAVSAPAAAQEVRQRPETRYCVIGSETGTILRNKICRTRAEWMKRGVDPIAK